MEERKQKKTEMSTKKTQDRIGNKKKKQIKRGTKQLFFCGYKESE